MKRLFAFIAVASMLTSVMMVTSYAGQDEYALEEVELWDEVITNLDENEYGGSYIDEYGRLHIQPIDDEEMQTMLVDIIPKTRDISSIVIDDEVIYTLQELNEASDKTEEIWEEFALDYVAIDEQHNGLLVGAYEWTTEKEEDFIKAVGIHNIAFETVTALEEELIENEIEEEQETRDTKSISIGRRAYNKNIISEEGLSLVSTIGACVVGTDGEFTKGYVTTAHTNLPQKTEKGQVIGGEAADHVKDFGVIYDRLISASKGIDIAIIENPEGDMYNQVLQGGRLMGSTQPRQGYRGTIFAGVTNKKIGVIVSSVNCKKYFTNPDDKGEHLFFNMVMLRIGDTYGNRTISGDSGSAVALPIKGVEDGYELIGIYKAADVTGESSLSRVISGDREGYTTTRGDRDEYIYLFATNWRQVENQFGVRMY